MINLFHFSGRQFTALLGLDPEDLAIERELIVGSLRSSGGEIAKASELMGMSRTTLWRKMKKMGIRPFEGV